MMILRVLWREAARFPLAAAASITLLLLISLSYVGQAISIAWALSAIITGDLARLWPALALIAAIAVARLGLALLQAAASARLGGRVRERVRRRALGVVLTPAALHDPGVRDGAVRASLVDGIDGVDTYVSRYIPALSQVFILCPVVIGVLASFAPIAAIAVAAGILAALCGPLAWKKMMARRGLDHWDSYEALSADLLESLRGMGTLRVLGAVPETRSRLHSRSEALRAATERVMRASLAETAVVDFAVQAGVLLAAIAALFDALTGAPPAFQTYLILLLASEAFRPIRELSRHWHAGFLGVSAVPGLTTMGVFDSAIGDPAARSHRAPAAPASPAPPRPRTGADRPATLQISHLHFSYPGAAEPVFSDASLRATSGSLTAIIGASGSGKSTLFDLLLGFLPRESGTVRFNGAELRPQQIAVVSQRPVLFAGTVRENLDVSGAGISQERLMRACADAGILEEILALPHGFDTEVAEAGASLSGGQRQRVALARALLAEREVLLVDEPTSALDDQRAAEIIQTLRAVARERIVLMISHRPEHLRDAGEIYRLTHGRCERTPS